MNILNRCWNAEPIVMAILGNAAALGAIFAALAAFGYPLTDQQQHALAGLAVIIAGILARSKAIAPDTHAETIAAIQKVNTL